MQMRKRLLLALAAPALVLAMSETAGRIWLVHFAGDDVFLGLCSPTQFERYGSGRSRFMLHPYLRYALEPGFERDGTCINNLGYRGEPVALPKPHGEYRIVCMGGSTTFDDTIERDEDAFTARLQYHLRQEGCRVSVLNAGVPGWMSYESLINYAFRVAYLEPDLIIPLLVWNDLTARLVHPPEAYRGDNTGVRQVHLGSFPLWERPLLVRAPLVAAGLIEPQMIRLVFGHAPTLRAADFPYGPFYEEHSLAEMLENNPPRYFRANLRHLAAMAEADGAQTLFITFPFSRTPKAFQDCFGIAPEDYTLYQVVLDAFDEMNAAVKSVAEERQALFFDLAAAYPNPDDYTELFADGFHNNPAGADLK
ncbi:MAG TPA: SGNH/GDSL hydrolase family protein, partial [Candidatus Hydrogenedentes bacterium]|nr:SGNH/GDSL hydrolase family protein [Candidatus Hydrogenedentota bacterium]